jgi:hypothetical protein
MTYSRFATMILASTVAMFVLMYLNTYALDHIYWSETRTWMALLMGATMAAIMMAFMHGMYANTKTNAGILVGAALIFALSLWLVRSQATVSGVDYMRAMIPHHSIAVLTSERAQIADPRVYKLADEIVAAQRREIAEMKYLIRAIERGPAPETETGPPTPPTLASGPEALRHAELARVDLQELERAEIDEVLGPGPRCSFAYSRHGGPVVAATRPAGGSGAARGLIKIHGKLVELHAADVAPNNDAESALILQTEGIEVRATPIEGAASSAAVPIAAIEAEAVLRLDADLEVGYGGFYQCTE